MSANLSRMQQLISFLSLLLAFAFPFQTLSSQVQGDTAQVFLRDGQEYHAVVELISSEYVRFFDLQSKLRYELPPSGIRVILLAHGDPITFEDYPAGSPGSRDVRSERAAAIPADLTQLSWSVRGLESDPESLEPRSRTVRANWFTKIGLGKQWGRAPGLLYVDGDIAAGQLANQILVGTDPAGREVLRIEYAGHAQLISADKRWPHIDLREVRVRAFLNGEKAGEYEFMGDGGVLGSGFGGRTLDFKVEDDLVEFPLFRVSDGTQSCKVALRPSFSLVADERWTSLYMEFNCEQ